MKSILLFFLLSVCNSFGQDYTTDELVIPVVYHSDSYYKWEALDSKPGFEGFYDADRHYTPELPNSQTSIDLFHSRFYATKGNRFIEFAEYPGDRFFFKEWSDSLRSDLLHFGEAEKDPANYRISETSYTSYDGNEDSVVVDTVFQFRKVGPWEFRLPDNTKLFGNYEYGKRAGTWTNYLNSFIASPDFLPTLNTFEYEAGVLKSKMLVDKSQVDYEEKLRLLKAKWGWKTFDAKGTALYKQGYKVLRFYKEEKAKFPCSGKFMNISTKNSLLKWQVNEDNTVSIEGMTFTILYLTEEQLLLLVVE